MIKIFGQNLGQNLTVDEDSCTRYSRVSPPWSIIGNVTQLFHLLLTAKMAELIASNLLAIKSYGCSLW